jgi:hypothetical protein
MARKGLVVMACCVLLSAACRPPVPGAAPPPPLPDVWPTAGSGLGVPWSPPDATPLAALAPDLRDLGWIPVAALPGPLGENLGGTRVVVAAARADGTGAWILAPAGGAEEAEPSTWPVVSFEGPLPLPIWFVALDSGPDAMQLVVAELGSEGTEEGSRHAAYRLAEGPDGPIAELFWEALEPPDGLAVVNLEGAGADDVVAVRWFDACPDPMLVPLDGPCGPPPPPASEGCPDDDAPAADPCLLVRVWNDGDGVPQTYRVLARPDGALSAVGDPALDRVAALLRLSACRYLDLRAMTVLPVVGLRAPGVPGELVEGLRCTPEPRSPEPWPEPLLILLDPPGGDVLPDGEVIRLRAPADAGAKRWADGYQLLDDLDGDGVPDWLWQETSAAGTRWLVTRGPGRRSVAGSFDVDADGTVLHRLVAAPLGGRTELSSLDWRPAPDPAAVLGIRFIDADGSMRVEAVALPLAFR